MTLAPKTLDPGSTATLNTSQVRAALSTFRELAERSTDAIALGTLKGDVVYVNPTGRSLLGLDEAVDFSLASVADTMEGVDVAALKAAIGSVTPAAGWRWRGRVDVRRRRDDPRVSVEVNAFILGDASNPDACLLAAIGRDVTLQVGLTNVLDQRNREISAINRVLRTTLTCETEQEIVEEFVTVAEDLTSSAMGFVAEVNASGKLDSLTVSPRGRAACSGLPSEVDGVIRDLPVRGFWGRAMKEGKPVIVNDPVSDPDRVGVPSWHAPINSFLGVPLRRDRRVCRLVCLANKAGGYRIEDGPSIERLADAFVEVFDRKREQREARERDSLHRVLFQNVSDVVLLYDPDLRVLDVSPSVKELAGLDPSQVIGRTISEFGFIAPGCIDRAVADAGRAVDGDDGLAEAYEIVVAGQQPRTLEVHNRTVVENGRPVGAVAVIRDVTERVAMAKDLEASLAKLRASMRGVVEAMSLAVESRDPYTAGHQRRVSNLARAIATTMGLSTDQVDAIRLAGIVHDIGKLSIPAEILAKPGKLTNNELALIRTHPEAGFEILKGIDFPWPIARIVLQHHERVDGTGYPHGTPGDDILIEARILAVADVVEAMASHRPYRPSLGLQKALETIREESGAKLDPVAVDACVRLFEQSDFSLT